MRPRWALNALVAVVLMACLAWLAPARARAVAAQSLAGSLENDPVQILGPSGSAYSAMSPKQVAGLRVEIARLDPGRIFIAFLSPRSQSALEDISNSAFGNLPAGTLISIADDPQDATTHFFVGSTWEDNGTAQNELNGVIQGYHHGCYAEAERQLKQADDPYHFDRALAAVKAGHRHVQAADQLFNPGGHVGTPRDETAVVERLEKLTTLHDSGALTDDEFGKQKRKLLDG